ncbi:MAG: homoserine dehydrogenase [Actinomycetes bacterium]|jgi:homoserine dehydrogenase|nr:homoserine dehydrogenase [Actinomycetes bacterium]
MRTEALKIALLGCGTVGAEVAQRLDAHGPELAARAGAPIELAGIAVRDPNRQRSGLDPALFTADSSALVGRPDVDIVVELIGGIEPARSLLLAAMERGASVVTANKALLATYGPQLYEAAEKHGVDLYFEASVAGAIPLLRPLRESLAGDRVRRVLGIVNGTTNFILTRMDETGADFATALAEATALGYAEADPTADVAGHDAAAKAAILASLAFHTRVGVADVYREGVTAVSAADVASAKDMGNVIKMLAICELSADEQAVSVRVHPAMIPRTHPLAGVREAFNAVFVEADAAGQLMFYGRGAGGAPTASAVLGDIVAVARHRVGQGRGVGESAYAQLAIRPIGECVTQYYVHLDVTDKAGVLAQVATVFAANGVSISTVRQDGHGAEASLVIVTHSATEAALAATVGNLRGVDVVQEVSSVLRVER